MASTGDVQPRHRAKVSTATVSTDNTHLGPGTGFFLPLAGRDTRKAKRRTRKGAPAAGGCFNVDAPQAAPQQAGAATHLPLAGDDGAVVPASAKCAETPTDEILAAATEAEKDSSHEHTSIMEQLVSLLKDMGPEAAHALAVAANRVAEGMEHALDPSMQPSPAAAAVGAAATPPSAADLAGSLANLLGPSLLPTTSDTSAKSSSYQGHTAPLGCASCALNPLPIQPHCQPNAVLHRGISTAQFPPQTPASFSSSSNSYSSATACSYDRGYPTLGSIVPATATATACLGTSGAGAAMPALAGALLGSSSISFNSVDPRGSSP